MDSREDRLARNEVLFREVNEQIERQAVQQGADPHPYEFFCECSNIDCALRLTMTLDVYEHVRADPTQFVVARGHELPEIEEVVVRTDAYEIVRKLGEAAELVAERDPRG